MTTISVPPLLRTSLLAGLVLGTRALAAEPDFQKDVLPLLQQKCIDCHGAEKQKGKLRLDSKEATFKGGKDGPAVKAKDAAGSELIKRVSLPAGNDDRMPPEGDGLTAEQITVLKAWIDAGAAWPEGVVIESKTKPKAAAAPVRQGPPLPALPELPKDFKAAAGEAAALATLSKAGLEVRPIAQNSPWHEANFRLAGTNLTDTSLAPLKEVTSLIELNLGATRVTDAGLASIANLGYLQNLQAPLTGITDAGIARLKGLSNLVSINLYGTQVSDAGLEHLKGLKHLRSVYVWQTKVTPEGAAKLKEALPWLYVNTGAELAALATNTPPTEKKEEKK